MVSNRRKAFSNLLSVTLDGEGDLVDVDGLLAQRRNEIFWIWKDLLRVLAGQEIVEEGWVHDRDSFG